MVLTPSITLNESNVKVIEKDTTTQGHELKSFDFFKYQDAPSRLMQIVPRYFENKISFFFNGRQKLKQNTILELMKSRENSRIRGIPDFNGNYEINFF